MAFKQSWWLRLSAKRSVSVWLSYAGALALTAVALGLTLLLAPVLERTPFLFFFASVLLSAWYCGLGPAVVSIALALLSVNYLFVEPIGSFGALRLRDAASLALFAVVAGLMTALGNAARRAAQQSGRDADALKEASRELARVNAELLRGREVLVDAQRSAQTGSWDWDVNTDQVVWSDEMYRVYGLEPQSIRVNLAAFMSFIHPDDRAMVQRVLETAMKTKEPFSFTHRALRPTGEIRWMRGAGQVVTEENGTVVRLIGSGQDVTDSVIAADRAERLLLITGELAKALTPVTVADAVMRVITATIGATHGGVRYLDEDGYLALLLSSGAPEHVAALNRRVPIAERTPHGLAARTGVPVYIESAEEYRDERYADAMTVVEALEIRASATVPLISGGRVMGTMSFSFTSPHEFPPAEREFLEEVAAHTAQALDRAMLIEAERDANARRQQLQSLATDLTRVLTRAEVGTVVLRHLVQAFDAYAGGVVELSSDGGVFSMIAGIGMDEVAMRRYRRFSVDAPVPTRDIVRTREPVFIADAAEWTMRYGRPPRVLGKDAINGSWAALPMLVEDRLLGAITVSLQGPRDFTPDERRFMRAFADLAAQGFDRARLHETEKTAREEAEIHRALAEDANRAKTEFLATMSHELRTPLNAIQGHAQLLEMEVHGPLTEAQREALDRVQRAQRHLLGLINDILNYAKLDAHRVEFDLREWPLADVLADVVPIMEPQLATKGISLTLVSNDDASIIVRADREKLVQVLLNLLSNAAKFSQSGGWVRINVATSDERPDLVHLDVSDGGIGIPLEHHERIFEPFVQVRSTSGGTGLGLAISRELIRGMGGEITVASVLGQGSTFRIALPSATAPLLAGTLERPANASAEELS
ncbi:MAG TPA: GAF domain-containing protein [Gemmatimonadaceae bacterium]|nr:GAF domain-containing protein [Gemmatimonadaceae bacterium]